MRKKEQQKKAGFEEELNNEVNELAEIYNKKKKEIKSDINTLEEELEKKEAQVQKEMTSYEEEGAAKKEEMEAELASLTSKIDSNKEEKEEIEAIINEKKEELEAIGTVIKEKSEEPVVLPAGMFVVGHDLPEGRYKAVPEGQGSNLFVNDNDGRSIVNTILSNRSDHGVNEYVFFVTDGFVIESRAPVKLIPIE